MMMKKVITVFCVLFAICLAAAASTVNAQEIPLSDGSTATVVVNTANRIELSCSKAFSEKDEKYFVLFDASDGGIVIADSREGLQDELDDPAFIGLMIEAGYKTIAAEFIKMPTTAEERLELMSLLASIYDQIIAQDP